MRLSPLNFKQNYDLVNSMEKITVKLSGCYTLSTSINPWTLHSYIYAFLKKFTLIFIYKLKNVATFM